MIQPWLMGICAGAASLLIYLRTMCRTIYVGDSGELAAAVHVLGIPHPPGYPLYVLLGKLFSVVVPFGSPALRLNLFSACCAACSAAILCSTLAMLGLDVWIAGGVSMAWALSASLWSQAGIARVYALGALLASAITFCFARWYVEPHDNGWLLAAALLIGLGLANHPVAGAHLPAVFAAVGFRKPGQFYDPLFWVLFLLCVLPGILLYFTWLPWRARRRPKVNWGNIKSLSDLWRFLSREEYWQHHWVRSAGDAVVVIFFYLKRTLVEFGFLGAAAIVAGMPLLIRGHRAVAAYAAVLVIMNGFSMIAHARREDIFHWTRYMITAWFALALFLAAGWAFIVGAFPPPLRPYAAFLPAALLLVTQFGRQDLSRHRYAELYSRRILESLPPNATLIAQDDNVVFPLMYLKYAENVRPDVKLLEQGVHQLATMSFNPRQDAIYCTHWQAAFNHQPTAQSPGLRMVQEGLIYRLVLTDMPFQPRDLWAEHLLPDMEDPSIPRNYLTRCLLGHVYFMRGQSETPRDTAAALAWFERSSLMAYDSAVQQYNLALMYERMGMKMLSDDAFARAAMIDRAYDRTRRRPAPEPPAA